MTPDREQTRRDAFIAGRADDGVALHKLCLALLAELEQAERERDEARRKVEDVRINVLPGYEARLAKVPALVEALRYCARRGAADRGTALKALAVWEQE